MSYAAFPVRLILRTLFPAFREFPLAGGV